MCVVWVYYQFCVWQLCDQFVGVVGVIQVYVGQDQLVYVLWGEFGCVKCGYYLWYGVVCVVVDESCVIVVYYEVGGVELLLYEVGVDGMDVVFVVYVCFY